MKQAATADPSYQWTAEEIEGRLACSTIVFPRDRLLLAEDIARMREVGIVRIEVCGLGNPGHLDFDDRDYISEVVSQCAANGVSVVSIHSPGYLYNSDDESNRRRAVTEGVVAAKIAEEMGAEVMVCHFRPEEPSERSVNEMLEQLEGHSIKLAIENGQDLADYTAFVDKVGSERFGMVVDIGHTRDEDGVNPFVKKGVARKTMAQCGGRLIHLHLHDWVDRDHFSPLDGDIQWDEVFAAFKDIGYSGWFMFEAAYAPGNRGELSPEYVLDKVATFPREFVKRYVS